MTVKEVEQTPMGFDRVAEVAMETFRFSGIQQVHLTIDRNGLTQMRWMEPGTESEYCYATAHSLAELNRKILGRGKHARQAHA